MFAQPHKPLGSCSSKSHNYMCDVSRSRICHCPSSASSCSHFCLYHIIKQMRFFLQTWCTSLCWLGAFIWDPRVRVYPDLSVKLFILADVGNPRGPAHTTVSPLILLVLLFLSQVLQTDCSLPLCRGSAGALGVLGRDMLMEMFFMIHCNPSPSSTVSPLGALC